MSANYLHGVETIEIDVGPRPIRQVKTAVVGLVGTAPMYDVASADRTLNVPKLILNDRQAAQYFGTRRTGFTIPYALDAIFDHGYGTVVAVNVLDVATHKTTVGAPGESKTFSVSTDTLTLAHPQVDTVVVKSNDGNTTYEEGAAKDYTVNYADGIITRVAGSDIASGATVKVTYKWLDVSTVANSDLIGEVDPDTGERSGLQALLDSFNLYGFYPKIIIVPGYCTQTAVATEMIAIAGKCRAITLLDAPSGTTVEEAITGRGADGDINFNVASERAMLCFPHLKVYDTDTNTEILEPMSQRLAGLFCKMDHDRGYWWSPSNQEFQGITGIERRITAMPGDPTSDANALNEVGITTVFNSFGTGLRAWGNRTAAWPTVTHPKNFVNIRRVADVIHESVEYSMIQFLDRPINDALIDAITESVNAFLRVLVGRGALIDGVCTYDPNKNPAVEIALGHLTFDVSFMPPPPAERITFESFIDINLLSQLGSSLRS